MTGLSRELSAMVALCWGILAMVAPAVIVAQGQTTQDGPIVIGRREQLETFRIERIRTTLELLVRHQVDQRNAQGTPSTRDEENEFRSFIRMEADAYVIHRNLLELSLMGRFEYRRTDIDSESTNVFDTIDDLQTEYNIHALALKKTDTPIEAYMRRSEYQIDRQFGDSLDSLVTEYGLGARLFTDKSSNRILAYRREQRQTDQRGRLDFGNDQTTLEFQSTRRLTDQQSIVLDYTYDNIDEFGANRAGNSFERHDLSINHEWWLDDEHNRSLRSWLNVFDQNGDVNNSRVRLLERLRLRHSPIFETTYTYEYNQTEQVGTSQERHRAQAGFRHKLYLSLTTTGNVGASRILHDAGEDDREYFGNLGFNYEKRVPYGRFFSNLSVDYNDQENGARGANTPFLDESYTFNDPNPIILIRDNIVLSSIVVTDAMGIQTYLEGIDYRVDDFPDRVELVRLLGGAITDGETVLVDYVVGPRPSHTLRTLATGIGLRYRIERGAMSGLSIFARYNDLDRQLETRDPGEFAINDQSVLTLGVDYRIGELWLEAEREWHDSDISPFNATRLTARYGMGIGRRSTLRFQGNYDLFDYLDTGESARFANLTATWIEQLSKTLRMNVTGEWQRREERSNRTTDGLEGRADLTWRYRQTEVYLSARYSTLETSTSDNTFEAFTIGYRRQF